MTKPALTFNEVAPLYHKVRPRYPQELFNALFKLTDIPKNARILEIGAGTGIATAELVKHGFHVVALEPGPEMALVLKQNLKSPNLEVIISTFEDWTLPQGGFDLVVSFTAFHWLDPATCYQRISKALSPSGYLAIVKYHHVAGGDRSFFYKVQEYYEKYMPDSSEFRLPEISEFKPNTQGICASGLFNKPIYRSYLTEETYSRADYEQLLLTYSDHRVLEEQKRSQLLNCIGTLIDEHYEGQIHKCYLNELVVARKR